METATVTRRAGSVWRKPKTMIIILIAIAIVLNLMLVLLYTLPAAVAQYAVQEEQARKQKQLDQLIGMPEAAQVSDAEIAALLEEAPTRLEAAGFYQLLTNYAARSGVLFTSYKESGQVASVVSELEQQINAISGSVGDASASPTPPPNNTQPAGVFRQDGFEVVVAGGLPHLFRFFDALAGHKQIMTIKQWNVLQLSEGEQEQYADFLPYEHALYRMNLTLVTYTIPQYEALFGAERQTGTTIDEALDQFKAKYPEIDSLDSIDRSAGKE